MVDHLAGDEPAVVRRWARVCAKAVRNAPFLNNMTRTERAILNMEYRAASQRFKLWRRKHIERFDEEDRIQAQINQMLKRERRWAQRALDEKRSAPGYVYDMYREDIDEDTCFELEPEDETAKLQDQTWRRGWNTVEHQQTPQQCLEAFERQVKAAEKRGPLEYHSAEIRERKLEARQMMREILELEIQKEEELAKLAIKKKEEEEKQKEEELFLAGIVEAMQNRVRLEDLSGVNNPALLVDTKLDFKGDFLQ